MFFFFFFSAAWRHAQRKHSHPDAPRRGKTLTRCPCFPPALPGSTRSSGGAAAGHAGGVGAAQGAHRAHPGDRDHRRRRRPRLLGAAVAVLDEKRALGLSLVDLARPPLALAQRSPPSRCTLARPAKNELLPRRRDESWALSLLRMPRRRRRRQQQRQLVFFFSFLPK